jgi:putative transposase
LDNSAVRLRGYASTMNSPKRMFNAEMDVHLANEARSAIAHHCNGTSSKTVLTPEGELTLSIPRDRHGRFDPAHIAKYRGRFR